MTYSESPVAQLSDELWHVFGGRRRFPTTRAHACSSSSQPAAIRARSPRHAQRQPITALQPGHVSAARAGRSVPQATGPSAARARGWGL